MPLMRRGLPSLLALALWLCPAGARAACQVALQSVVFGSINVLQNNLGNGRVDVTCTAATSFQVGIPGADGDGLRTMTGPGGALLDYYLSSQAGFGTLWGDGASAVSGTNNGSQPTSLIIYGVVPQQPGMPPGAYAAQLFVTLTF
ncbi:MAG TPA: spore coat protein U domain-containing protein [Geminicoccaceae bacterium]|nr:spore coat protein U domain-containing protein [Geminicoccaceae bacterium]